MRCKFQVFALPAHIIYISMTTFLHYCCNDAMNPILSKSQWFTIIWTDLSRDGCISSMPGGPHGQVLVYTWLSFKSFLWWRSSNISMLRSCQSEDDKRLTRHFHWPLKMPLERDPPWPSLLFHWPVHSMGTNPSLTRWDCTLLQVQVGKGE